MRNNTPPIILIGMHRSGTSMLSHALEGLGLFQGLRKDENNESFHFIKLNNWLLHNCGARWDFPRLIHPKMFTEDLLDEIVEYLKMQIFGLNSIKFFGFDRTVFWGWKDPRNTLTLAIWLTIFPDAKVLNITRHPLDIASSLNRRSIGAFRWSQKKKILNKLDFLSLKKGIFTDSVRCMSLDASLDLAIEYMKLREENSAIVPKDNYMNVKFEDVVDSFDLFYEVVRFVGLNCSLSQAREKYSYFDKSKILSYRSNDRLVSVGHENANSIHSVGYTI